MTTITIEVQDSKQLADLLDQVEEGTEVILTKNQQPRARVVPIAPRTTRRRVLGLHPGNAVMSPDFDDPLPDEFWTGTP